MCNQDLILEKIQHLSEKIDQGTNQTKRELDAMNSHLSTMNSSIATVSERVNKQNGRVANLEAAQHACPGKVLTEKFTQFETDLKPVYILSTNYRMIAFLIVGAALAFRVIDLGFSWFLQLFSL